MVNPTLIPDTVNGYLLPRKISTPSPATDADDESALGEDNRYLADLRKGRRRQPGRSEKCQRRGQHYSSDIYSSCFLF